MFIILFIYVNLLKGTSLIGLCKTVTTTPLYSKTLYHRTRLLCTLAWLFSEGI